MGFVTCLKEWLKFGLIWPTFRYPYAIGLLFPFKVQVIWVKQWYNLKMMSQLGILLWKTRLENLYFKNIQQAQVFFPLEYFQSYVVSCFGRGFYSDNTWAKSNIFIGQVWWFYWAWISRNCNWQGCSGLVSIFFEWSINYLRFSLQKFNFVFFFLVPF